MGKHKDSPPQRKLTREEKQLEVWLKLIKEMESNNGSEIKRNEKDNHTSSHSNSKKPRKRKVIEMDRIEQPEINISQTHNGTEKISKMENSESPVDSLTFEKNNHEKYSSDDFYFAVRSLLLRVKRIILPEHNIYNNISLSLQNNPNQTSYRTRLYQKLRNLSLQNNNIIHKNSFVVMDSNNGPVCGVTTPVGSIDAPSVDINSSSLPVPYMNHEEDLIDIHMKQDEGVNKEYGCENGENNAPNKMGFLSYETDSPSSLGSHEIISSPIIETSYYSLGYNGVNVN